jgi:hypothetical protein
MLLRMPNPTLDRIGCVRAAAALALVASLAACSAPRTWPSLAADQDLSADTPPLPQVVTDALAWAHDQVDAAAPKVFNLPAEINLAAWPTFERGLPGWKPMCPGDVGVWTVRQVRIDGGIAQVDIEYPSRDGFYQTLTVHMLGGSAGLGYKPDYLQYWKLPVKDPVCQQPLSVVEKACGAAAADRLRAQREPKAVPPSAQPAPAQEPSK